MANLMRAEKVQRLTYLQHTNIIRYIIFIKFVKIINLKVLEK